jgi:hypothetical protein
MMWHFSNGSTFLIAAIGPTGKYSPRRQTNLWFQRLLAEAVVSENVGRRFGCERGHRCHVFALEPHDFCFLTRNEWTATTRGPWRIVALCRRRLAAFPVTILPPALERRFIALPSP